MLYRFKRKLKKTVGALCVSGVAVVSTPVFAVVYSAVAPELDLNKKLKLGQAIQPLEEDAFGEKFAPKYGQLSFRQVDFILNGTGPAIEIARYFSVMEGYDASSSKKHAFSDWELDLPRITTFVPSDKNTTKSSSNAHGFWRVEGGNPGAVCTTLGMPAPSKDMTGYTIQSADWWTGVQLVVGGEEQEVLRFSGNRTVYGNKVYNTTKNNWNITCLSSTANGEPGESFLAVSPEGTRYWFSWLGFQPATATSMPGSLDDNLVNPPINFLKERADFMPTRIEDKNGNHLTFTYQPGTRKLLSIASSDGRKVEFTWNRPSSDSYTAGRFRDLTPFIDSVTAIGVDGERRKWTYSYEDVTRSLSEIRSGQMTLTTLRKVVQPDGRFMELVTHEAQNVNYNNAPRHNQQFCSMGEMGNFPVISISMKHPSGLRSEYKLGRVWFARNKPDTCENSTSENIMPIDNSPTKFWLPALLTKTYTDPSTSQSDVTTYSYPTSAGLGYTYWNHYPGGSTSVTTIKDPGGKTKAYTYSNLWGETDGELQRVDEDAVLSGSSVVSAAKTELYTYASSDTGPFLKKAGVYPLVSITANPDKHENNRPLKSRVSIIDSDAYTVLVNSFDSYANPINVSYFNSIPGQPRINLKKDSYNDLAKGIIGLPLQATNTDTGEVVGGNTYDPVTANVISKHEFGLLKMSYTWDGQGNIATQTDGNGNTVTYSSYKLGIPQLVTYPGGVTEAYTVNGFGEVTSHTDQVGATRFYSYDDNGWVLSESQPSGDSVSWFDTNYIYDHTLGTLKVTKTTGGVVEETFYDAKQRPVKTIRTAGGVSIGHSTKYDWKGREIFNSYPEYVSGSNLYQMGIHTTYDSLDRVTKSERDSELGRLSTSTRYLSGLVTEITNPKGLVKTIKYQALNEPVYDFPIESIWGSIKQVTGRDVYGNILSITQSGSYDGTPISVSKNFYYDANKQLCRIYEPETGSTLQELDGAGNVKWAAFGQSVTGNGCSRDVANDKKVRNYYDSMNRLLRTVYPDGTPERKYTYSGTGKILSASAGNNMSTYSYNQRGLLESESIKVDAVTSVVAYRYDSYGYIAEMTYPNGKVVSYNPDGFGRASQAAPFATDAKYFANGQLQSLVFGNGVKLAASQNARGTLGGMAYHAAGDPIFKETYKYDANGNLLEVLDGTASPLRTKTMQYDSVDRLIESSSANVWGKETYSYDPLNNLRTVSNQGGVTSFKFDSRNRLVDVLQNGNISQHREYDGSGNTVLRGAQALAFNMAKQLVNFGGTEEYGYDAFGNRAKTIGSSGSLTYGYNQNSTLLFERDAALAKYTNYYYLNGRLLAKEVE